MAEQRDIEEVLFAGSHRERGRRRGQMLRGKLELPAAEELPRDFVGACRRAAEELYPPVAEEFSGILETGQFEEHAFEAHYFARLESRLGGCTMFAVEPARLAQGRGTLVGRNYDWAVSDLAWCRLHRFEPQDGPRRIAYTHHWAGSPDVLNEWGLYVAIASLPAEPVAAPGVQWSILVEALSETCRTVEQAVGLCAGARHLRPMSYLLADAQGGAAVVEATPHAVWVRRPREGLVLAANHRQGGQKIAEWPEDEAEPVLTPPSGPEVEARRTRVRRRSECRVERAHSLLEPARPVDRATVEQVLSDHEAPICTGDHTLPDGGYWATIWSGISRPAQGEFAIAPGLPCRHAYRGFTTVVS